MNVIKLEMKILYWIVGSLTFIVFNCECQSNSRNYDNYYRQRSDNLEFSTAKSYPLQQQEPIYFRSRSDEPIIFQPIPLPKQSPPLQSQQPIIFQPVPQPQPIQPLQPLQRSVSGPIEYNHVTPSSSSSIPLSINRNSNFNQDISKKISRNIMELSQKILNKIELISDGTSKAQLFSPITIASVLQIILLGSNTRTYQELMELFGFNRDNTFQSYKFHEEFGFLIQDLIAGSSRSTRIQSRPQPFWKTQEKHNLYNSEEEYSSNPDKQKQHQIEIANAIFAQNDYSLRREYEIVAKNVYMTDIIPLDFHRNPVGSVNYVNDWCNRKTHGKIKEIIDHSNVGPSTNAIIASALYFKALWEKSFFVLASQNNFYPNGLNAAPIKVRLMGNVGYFPFYNSTEYGCEIIGFPYKGNQSTMYIIHPYDSDSYKLQQFQKSLDADKIDYMISRMIRRTATVVIPKFHITNTINLANIFKKLGVQTLFDPSSSDLSLLSDGYLQNHAIQNHNQHLIRVPLYHISNLNNNISTSIINRTKRATEDSFIRQIEPIRLRDFVIPKPNTKQNFLKKLSRSRRQTDLLTNSIKNLDLLRNNPELRNPGLFVDEIIHKIDLIVDEEGTEGGAVTAATIRRSGTDVVFRADTPFIILVRHDSTEVPLFYGSIYEPTTI